MTDFDQKKKLKSHYEKNNWWVYCFDNLYEKWGLKMLDFQNFRFSQNVPTLRNFIFVQNTSPHDQVTYYRLFI